MVDMNSSVRMSNCVVFETLIKSFPDDVFYARAWNPDDKPITNEWENLKTHPKFEIDKQMDLKLLNKDMYSIISVNFFFDKALLSEAEGLSSNGIGASNVKDISCTFLSVAPDGYLKRFR